jgi:DNA polymerase-3 subunit delta
MIYLFHGPDDFTRTQKIAQLRAQIADPTLADLNIAHLEGRDLKLSAIRHYADAMPFMADKRLVIVQGFIAALKGQPEASKQLVDYFAQLPPTTDLVLVEAEALEARHPVLKAALAAGVQVEQFSGPDKNNLRPWIINRAKELGAVIEPAAAELLGKLVGVELRTLSSELEKLTLYVGGNQRPINRADVELLVPYVEDSENFGLANAIGQRNARMAYDQLHKMLEEDRHPMAILASIATQIRGLLEIKDMAERGMSPQEIAAKKNWRSDYAVRIRLKEGQNFSAARLEEILEMLLEIDRDIKTGRIDNLLALDTLIARLCAMR